MPNMTLSIPEDLKARMDRFKEINWSEVARQAIYEKTSLLERMNQMLSKSALRAADAEQASYRVNKKVFKRHKAR